MPANPRIAANQQRRFLALMRELGPHLRSDSSLPQRIRHLLKRDRSAGSRDRRLYRELVYTALRYLPWVDQLFHTDPANATAAVAFLAPQLPEVTAFRDVFCEGWPPPDDSRPVAERAVILRDRLPGTFEPSSLLPAWLQADCPAAFEPRQLDAIQRRAPLWVRLQVENRELVLDEFRRAGWQYAVHPQLPDAVRLPANADVGGTDAFRRGFVEIQDLGSQLVLLHAPVVRGSRWLDACAGAGGKSLQLARLLGPDGSVDAMDIRPAILDELRERARRARVGNIAIVSEPDRGYDGVLVDAPCSGSGTWRRQPHLKWCTNDGDIDAFSRVQRALLNANAERVHPGGLLLYATCSLSSRENRGVCADFLASRPEFLAERPVRDWGGMSDGIGTTLLPGTLDSDGFYITVLRRSRT